MAQAILISKIIFAGISGLEYFHIICENNSVIINPLERKKALEIIKEEQLVLAKPETYLGQYDPKLGRFSIYSKRKSKTEKSYFPTFRK